MERIPEKERMDQAEAVNGYAQADFADVNERFVNAVVEAMNGERVHRMLDLGSGPGDIPVALVGANACVKLVAVEASAEMLTWAARRVSSGGRSDRVVLVRGDAKALPFEDGVFTAVVSNSILHHVSDPHLFWQEVGRMLPPGGRVFMRDLLRPDNIADARALVDEYARDESEALRGEFFRSLCAAYTVDEVRDQLRRADLSMLNVRVSSDRHLDVFGRAT